MRPPSGQSGSVVSRAARFGTTHWSMVLKAGLGSEDSLLKLCQTYWPPLYAYVRRRGHSVHEAQDLTQAFFAHFLEHRALAAVAPEKGRFRSFLLIALKHFLDNEWHKVRTLKRGGGHVIISWDDLKPEDRESLEPSDQSTPERVFNRRWALRLLERAMDQLRIEYQVARKAGLFEELRGYLTADAIGSPGKTYQEVAVELGMTEGAVKVTVHRLRRRFGELVREQIARTVDNPEEIDAELRELFSALS